MTRSRGRQARTQGARIAALFGRLRTPHGGLWGRHFQSPPRAIAISPVRTISINPWGRIIRSKASILSAEPVTSIVIARRETSTILARKISANWMISARLSTAAETLNIAISRATVSSGSISRIFSTLTSLCSCLVTWSIGWTTPSRVRVTRETLGSSVGPTASVSMLKPRRENRPAIRASTPGLFSTRIERMCLRPLSCPGTCRSSSRTTCGVPASIMGLLTKQTKDAGSAVCSAHKRPRTPVCAASGGSWRLDHVARRLSRRDHRVAVLLLGDAHVEQHRAVGLQRLRHRPLELVGALAAQPGRAEGLGQLHPVGAGAHLDRAVTAGPEELLPLADHAHVAVVHQEDLDRDPFGHAGRELLAVHDQAAVAGEADDVLVGAGDLGADRGGQAEAHRAQAAGVDPVARLLEAVVLRRPHLVLADV